jgi:hypothetical protein
MRQLPLVLLFVLAACKGDPLASYETYQDCFDDVTGNGMLEVVPAIVRCCIQHPIDGDLPACGETAADCLNYLADNLDQTDSEIGQRIEACDMVEDMVDSGPA